ncbi:MAG: bacteriochlorophyll 4-vinyl reductase [Pseudomonadota bacterium]
MAIARIGPNAILRVAEALNVETVASTQTDETGIDLVRTVFGAAKLEHHLESPPQDMVPEDDVVALQDALWRLLGNERADMVNCDAGQRTARYLLNHRIPRPAQWLMKILPAPLAARILMSSIGHHAWTFAGSGSFSWQGERAGMTFRIADCPYCRGSCNHGRAAVGVETQNARSAEARPTCSYVAATFEYLFRVLVQRTTVVKETACQGHGAPACEFEIRWRSGQLAPAAEDKPHG